MESNKEQAKLISMAFDEFVDNISEDTDSLGEKETKRALVVIDDLMEKIEKEFDI